MTEADARDEARRTSTATAGDVLCVARDGVWRAQAYGERVVWPLTALMAVYRAGAEVPFASKQDRWAYTERHDKETQSR